MNYKEVRECAREYESGNSKEQAFGEGMIKALEYLGKENKKIIPLKFNGSYEGVVYNGNDYAVEVKENSDGIILDVWVRDGELLETYTFWNDDLKSNK